MPPPGPDFPGDPHSRNRVEKRYRSFPMIAELVIRVWFWQRSCGRALGAVASASRLHRVGRGFESLSAHQPSLSASRRATDGRPAFAILCATSCDWHKLAYPPSTKVPSRRNFICCPRHSTVFPVNAPNQIAACNKSFTGTSHGGAMLSRDCTSRR